MARHFPKAKLQILWDVFSFQAINGAFDHLRPFHRNQTRSPMLDSVVDMTFGLPKATTTLFSVDLAMGVCANARAD